MENEEDSTQMMLTHAKVMERKIREDRMQQQAEQRAHTLAIIASNLIPENHKHPGRDIATSFAFALNAATRLLNEALELERQEVELRISRDRKEGD